jgi:hypothetical protein
MAAPAASITLYRDSYASTLISSLAFGKSKIAGVGRARSGPDRPFCAGAFAVLAAQSIAMLWARRRRTGRTNVALAYSLVMAAVSTVWYCAGARWSAYTFVDAMFHNIDANAVLCAPAGLLLKVMATVQILLSDALLVCPSLVWNDVMV